MICERLVQKREEAGLKQAELARRIGVGRDSYNRYEHSKSKPSIEILALIANELNTSTDYLLGNTDNPAPPGQKTSGFAKRFMQLRMERSLSHDELVDDFNKKYQKSCTKDIIKKYENGQRIPEITTLMDFADYFEVSETYLLGESEIKKPDTKEIERRYRAKKLIDFEYNDWQVRKIIEDGELDIVYEAAVKALGVEDGGNFGLNKYPYITKPFNEPVLQVNESDLFVSEKQHAMDKKTELRAVIQLDESEFSLITDFKDMCEDSKKILCQIAKILVENTKLKKINKL